VDEWLTRLIEVYPVATWLVAVVLAAAFFAVLLVRILRSEETSIGPIHIKGSATMTKLRQAVRALNRDSEQKKHVIRLNSLFARDLASLLEHDRDSAEFRDRLDRLFTGLVSGIPETFSAPGRYRCAILVPDRQRHTLIAEYGHRYSADGLERLKLPVDASAAGYVLTTGRRYYAKDVRADPLWKEMSTSSVEYKSMVCLPVRHAERTVAVLRVECTELSGFSDDEMFYLEVFAAQAAILLRF